MAISGYFAYWNLAPFSHGATLLENGTVKIERDGLYEIQAQVRETNLFE